MHVERCKAATPPRRARRRKTKSDDAEPIVVRLVPNLRPEAASILYEKDAPGFTLKAGEVVELDPETDAELIDRLRRWSLHDGPGSSFGEAGFVARHEVMTRSAWDKRVATARARLSESAQIAADAAALTAAKREVAKTGDPSDIGLLNSRVVRRSAS